MIRYSIDSTLTLREVPVFKSGRRGLGDYERNNSSSDGFSLSNSVKRKIKQCVSGYFLENDHLGKNISWVTLTVPPRVDGFEYQSWCDDTRIIKQLSKFLENLRKRHGLKGYLWVAERQDGKRNNYEHCSGAIHFHCIFDFQGFIDYRSVNLYWLKLMNEIGYKAFSKQHFDKIENDLFSIEKTYQRYSKSRFKYIAESMLELPKYQEIIKNYADLERQECLNFIESQNLRDCLGGRDAMDFNIEHPVCKIAYNPVDIDRIKMNDFEKLQTYLTKYVTKNETKIYGRVWSASRNFTSVNYELIISPSQAAELKNIEGIVIHESESKFDIGVCEYVAKSSKLDYSKFIKTSVYLDLMESITTQRLNPLGNQIPEHIPLDQHFKFVSDAFKALKECTYFANNESSCTVQILPVSSMPINENFDKYGNEEHLSIRKNNPRSRQLQFEFDIENDMKTFKY